MADTEFFQLVEDFLASFLIELFHAGAAVGGDDAELVAVGAEQAGDEVAAARLEVAQDAHLVVEALRRVRPVIDLEHAAVETQMHGGAQCVFDLEHPAANMAHPGGDARRHRAKKNNFIQAD